MGVSFDKSRNRFRASTVVNGKTKHIGRYKTRQEADEALKTFEDELAFEDKFYKQVTLEEDVPVTPLYQDFDIYFPIGEQKPSLWDRIKSIWQRKPRDN